MRTKPAPQLVVSLPLMRQWIGAGLAPIDPRHLLALIEAVEADHEWHIYGSQAAWNRRERAFSVFEWADQ